MKKSNLPGLLLVLVLTGCASTSSDDGIRGSGVSPSNELVTSNQLPGGSKINMTQSMIMGSGSNWFGRMVLELPSTNDAYGFFLEQYPLQGWTLVSAVRGKASLLVFSRADRSATIEMTDGTGLNTANAVLTISPKSTLPGQPGTAPMSTPVRPGATLPAQVQPQSTSPASSQMQSAPRPINSQATSPVSSNPSGTRP